MKKQLITILLALVFITEGHAQEDMQQTLSDGSSLLLYGAGIYRDLGEDIYVGAVYLRLLDFQIKPENSKRMEMRIAAQTLSARRFTGLWTDAITLSSTRDERAQYVEEIQHFGKLFRENLLRGDQVSFDYFAAEQITKILINDVLIGEIQGEGFHRILLDSWIGNAPLNTQLKAGILNKLKPHDSAEINTLLASLNYSEDRQLEVASQYANVALLTNSAAEEQEAARLEELARQEEQARLEEQQRQAAEQARREELARQAEAQRQAELAALAQAEAEEQARREAAEAAAAAERQALFEAEQAELAREYRLELVRWLTGHVDYPTRALERRIEGRVELEITSARDGSVVGDNIVSSSGNAILDQAAMRMLERANPLPEMPDNLAGDTFSFSMPVVFALGASDQ